MLRWRLISAAVIISILVSLLWIDFSLGKASSLGMPGLCLVPLGLVFACLAADELRRMFALRDLRPAAWSMFIGTVLTLLAACVPVLWKDYPADCVVGRLGWPVLALAAGIGLAFVGEMLRYKQPGGVIVNVALSVFAMSYVGLLMGFIALLRIQAGNAWGLVALLSVVIVVKVSDSGAYFTGRAIGKHKLAPKLSPGKTIEGVLGGLVTGCLAAWLVFRFLAPWITGAESTTKWWQAVAYGLILSITGIVGDLSESLIKRDMGSKDSSSWLPGLGGVLDILDSILAAAPAAYACWLVGLVGS